MDAMQQPLSQQVVESIMAGADPQAIQAQNANTEIMKLLVQQLGKSEPASSSYQTPVSSALAGAGGAGLGLTPEQVTGGYTAALGTAGADLEYDKQALARALMPAEQAYKTGQAVKAFTEAGIVERKMLDEERKTRLLAVDKDLGFIEQKALKEAQGKAGGEFAAMQTAAKAMDEYATQNNIAPITIETPNGPISISLGALHMMSKDPAYAAWIQANSNIIRAQIEGKSRVEAAGIHAGAVINADKMELANTRNLLTALATMGTIERGDLTAIGKPSTVAPQVGEVIEHLKEGAGIKSPAPQQANPPTITDGGKVYTILPGETDASGRQLYRGPDGKKYPYLGK